jgi:YHS domain-containing protein
MRISGLLCQSMLCLTVLGVTVLLTGCSGSADKPDPKKPAAAATVDQGGDKEQADAAGLAELSAADRKLAEKQKFCPVTGEQLGAMGKPFKVTVKGQTVFLCCPGCEEKIKKDPDKYLAKLKEQGAK